jgi:hypothetical protein
VLEYWLDIGTTPGGSNLLHQSQGTNLAGTVSELPTSGQPVYVRLWSRFTGVWQQFNDYTYTACSNGCGGGGGPAKAQLQTPIPGTVLAGATATFTWTAGSGVTQYFLDVGTTQGGINLYHQSQGTNLSGTVPGLPTDGLPLWARLWSLINGTWQLTDYAYTAACGSGCGRAVMQSPLPGSVLPGATVTFTWTAGTGVTQYWLSVGTTPSGIDLYNQSQGTNLSGTVSGLPSLSYDPAAGRLLYVRLGSLIDGVWQFNDYIYTAATCSDCPAILSPPPGSALLGPALTFTWSSGGPLVLNYSLDVGNTPGAKDIYSQSLGLNLSTMVSGLPVDGRVLYIRLRFLVQAGSHTQVEISYDYVYKAAVSP